MSLTAEKRIAMGAADPTIFDYCNGSSRPSDRDIFDALRLNPKVRICPLSGAAVRQSLDVAPHACGPLLCGC